ncbi:PAN1 [Symbiodinium natans]|uniref:PAN1 protein n=1 Tax=Symbiodinium natans TaxID=878477 RepID=A0A812THV9_9DINO|nr:PAN1 [Symbiodinium natans]
MNSDPNIWFYRPMQEDLLTYASQDVMYLPLLHRRLCDELGDVTGARVLSRSRQYVNYSKMNLHLASPKAAERRGLRLQAMLATHTEAALYFKLNLGAHRQGVVSRTEALKNFNDMQYGDIADCWVSAWNTGGNILFLERLEAGHAFPEHPDFTSGKMGRRRRRRPVGSSD